MLNSLKELIFGLNEFEKAKIDERINQAFLLVPKIELRKLEDFELLEECIYKLKEQLRIKSSNLNRVVKSSKIINKKKVLAFIKDLEDIRYDFLKEVFAKINPNEVKQIQEPIKEEVKTEQSITLSQEPKEETKEEISDLELIDNEEYRAFLNNGVMPYIIIDFKKSVDYNIIKEISSEFFDLYQMHGTNVIIEGNKALILSRVQSDNVLNLPQIQSDLDDVFNRLKGKLKENDEENIGETKTEVKEEIKTEVNDETKTEVIEQPKEEIKDEYVEISSNYDEKRAPSKRNDDNSLDALLGNIEDKKPIEDATQSTKVTEDKVESDNDVKIEPKTEFVEIEKDTTIQSNGKKEETGIELLKEEVPENLKRYQFEVYRDEKVVAYFQPDSKVFGELRVSPINSEPLTKLNDADLSYVTIFSKVFTGLLFELMQCHGTNIYWDFDDNAVRIVPRVQDDNLKINWEPKQTTEETINELRGKLLKVMSGEKAKEDEPIKVPEVEKESDERAKYILDSLKRIP